ncbi:MAG: metallophosphoesterase [Clostridia bacterium]|nr:metallophosphoesterase [Clostridia bacterium]
MALWAIGDLHLTFAVNKPMTDIGPEWKHHVKKIQKNFEKKIRPDDTVVIVGDLSWGRNLEQCKPDFDFLESLPGRKILVRGNHDMYWDAKKTERLNEHFRGRLEFLQNNFCTYGDYALVGTKGYCFENKDSWEHHLKIVEREAERLRVSFESAKQAGYNKFICFLHYPPTTIGYLESPFTQIAEEYGAEQLVYAHCHGWRRWNDSLLGTHRNIKYSLVSGDSLNFKPKKITD